ncbi:hypothetical protein [Latilactobacillus fuchuensis]|uniref:Uncharacterized protein n=1 Tax=Latilactobacillus fuchuensis TaxID=164393 RepID=A0A2N9DYC2_9LACO|nr:hypothetical protein [Latilactobacillus fuchuensis]SPC40145.1 conserved hypothetical protein [Latilactobacillus fuchuensis]
MAKLKRMLDQHPYISLLVIVLLSSLIGILVEYIVNRDFIKDGFWTTGFIVLISLGMIRRQRK